jgi:hypothetical protein
MVKEPPLTFPPRIGLFAPELFAKVFTNQRMRIEMPRIIRIFSGKESCSS